jgi:hypothetical protein
MRCWRPPHEAQFKPIQLAAVLLTAAVVYARDAAALLDDRRHDGHSETRPRHDG